MNISKLSVAVEVDGKPYFVKVDPEHTEIILHMLQGLSPTRSLDVMRAPADFKFTTMGELRKEAS
ncbi:MAG: hypothetical protein ACRC8N_14055 [Aeromonas veronii]